MVTILRLEFDDNLLAFRPIELPNVVHMSDLPDAVGRDHANTVMELYESTRAKILRISVGLDISPPLLGNVDRDHCEHPGAR